MKLEDSLKKILNAFLVLELDPNIKDQIAKAEIGEIEKTRFGIFANMNTTSMCISEYDDANPNVSIIRTLLCSEDEIGDAILHSNSGTLQYFEVQFYDGKGWGCIEKASLV